MQKDYRKALKYCKLSKLSYLSCISLGKFLLIPCVIEFILVLDFEPNNMTAKEFYPLIEERMRCKFETI